jgi:hypothetical protein
VASRAPGPAGARRLLSRGDVAERRCLPGRPMAGSRLSRLAVLAHARSGLREMADAGTAPGHRLPATGPGDTDTAGCPAREHRGGQHIGCRAGQRARCLAHPARAAPVRGGVLAGARRASGLPPGLLRPVRLLRVHSLRGGLGVGAGGDRDAAAGRVLRRAHARRTVHTRPAARRAATGARVYVRLPALSVSRPVLDGGDQRRADRRLVHMGDRHGRGSSGRSRGAHGGRRPDQVRPRAARVAVPRHQAGTVALCPGARRLARRDARLAAHHLRPGPILRLDIRIPADTAGRRPPVQHLDLHAARGDRGKASARRRASPGHAGTDAACSRAGRAGARRSRRRAPARRAATPGLLVLQLPHLVLPAPHRRGHPSQVRRRGS